MWEVIFFGLLAAATILTALLVILQRNPVISAIFLILTFFSLAGIYLLLNAQFIAVIQLLVYAGAIMVLFLFVIMLLNLERERQILIRNRVQKAMGIFLGLVLFFQIGAVFHSLFLTGEKGSFSPEKVAVLGNTEVIARLLFTDFLLPFEITSVLLLAAIVGAMIMAKREI